MKATPFVKWAGGKRQIMSDLLTSIPVFKGKYIEPFVGGGALFFSLQLNGRETILNDINTDLVLTYKIFAKKKESLTLYKKLKEHEVNNSKTYYYKIRNLQSSRLGLIDRVARFLYLNRTCYNGLYRVNNKGDFNVPFNGNTKKELFNFSNFEQVNSYMEKNNVKIFNKDYLYIIKNKCNRGDFVYIDPPYDTEAIPPSFTKYNQNGFNRESQVKLFEAVELLNKRGVKFLMSNSGTEFIKELYQSGGYKLRSIYANRNINSNGKLRTNIEEVLISNYE